MENLIYDWVWEDLGGMIGWRLTNITSNPAQIPLFVGPVHFEILVPVTDMVISNSRLGLSGPNFKNACAGFDDRDWTF